MCIYVCGLFFRHLCSHQDCNSYITLVFTDLRHVKYFSSFKRLFYLRAYTDASHIAGYCCIN